MLVLAALVLATPAQWTAGGHVEQDVRVALPDGEKHALERVQTSVALRVEGAFEDGFRVVADGRVLHRGEPDAERPQIGERVPHHPWRLDGDALFVEARGSIGWLRLGRQSVRWGKALVGNAGSLVSPPDLEDPLRFGAARGAEMARVLLAAGPFRVEGIALHGPRPALLPPLDARDALANSGNASAADIARDPTWTVDLRARDSLPEATFAEAPLAARISGGLPFLGTEIAATYYRGRAPLPEVADVALDVDIAARRLSGDVRLTYPRLQSFGGELVMEVPVPVLESIAFFGEWAWIVPDGFTRRASALGIGQRERVFEDPYPRAVAGVERAGDTYVALEWSRGFLDEFGKNRQGEYLFAILERRFLRERLFLRVVAGHCFGDGSGVLAPDLGWSVADAVTLSLGAYAGFGSDTSKFAGPLAGDPVVLARARASF